MRPDLPTGPRHALRPDPPTAAPAPGQGTVVVLGGYGAVGRAVAETLAGWLPGRVVVAGRNRARAAAVAHASGGAITAAEVDVTRPDEVRRVLDGARVVVMCIEQANQSVARACLERGVHYVDVSATEALLSAMARLDGLARRNAATAVLSVGLAPGLTNLLARRSVDLLGMAAHVDLTLLFGLAGDHGPDAARWAVDTLLDTPARARGDDPGPVRVPLPGFGTRTAHPFAFSDQHAVARTLGVTATTRLCFESAAVTAAIFALRAAGVFAVLRRLGARRPVLWALTRLRAGSDRFVVQARASTPDGRSLALSASGRGESRGTGVVAAHVARLLHTRPVATGVHHIDEVTDVAALLDDLAQEGISLHRTDAAAHAAPGTSGARRRRRA